MDKERTNYIRRSINVKAYFSSYKNHSLVAISKSNQIKIFSFRITQQANIYLLQIHFKNPWPN